MVCPPHQPQPSLDGARSAKALASMKLLLVEDDARLVRSLVRGLTEDGHQVDVCQLAQHALPQAIDIRYDAIVLDWMLPDGDGLSLVRQWRTAGLRTPVLMLTARGTVPEKVQGLRAGADDYLTKPFDFEELLARLAALHRRSDGMDADLTVGDVQLQPRRRQLVCAGKVVDLTPREFALASALFGHAGDVLTRTELLDKVWGTVLGVEGNIIDVYIGYLRKKFTELQVTGAEIRTVRGIGYCLQAGKPAGEEAP